MDEYNEKPVAWRIGLEPAELSREEFKERYWHIEMPEKFETSKGKLFWRDEERKHLLLMLIESFGVARVLEFLPEDMVKLQDQGD